MKTTSPIEMSEVTKDFSVGTARVLHSTASGAYDRSVTLHKKNVLNCFGRKVVATMLLSLS